MEKDKPTLMNRKGNMMGWRMMVRIKPYEAGGAWLRVFLLGVLLAGGCQAISRMSRHSSAGRAELQQAQLYKQQGKLDSALAAFGLALEENPKLLEAHMGMGEIYHERGQYELASSAYERATKIEPNNFDAQYYLGLMQQLLGRLEKAVSTYLRALTINPDHYDANAHLASAYLQLAQPESALPYAKRATQLKPEEQTAWANLADTYSMLGDYRQAIDAYRQASELGDAAEPILLGLADAHIRLGNYPEAENVLKSILGTQPSATAYERMGYVRFKQRQFLDALNQFNQALTIDPNDTTSLNGVGVAKMTLFLKGGRTDRPLREQALEAWRKSLRIKPQQPRIIDLLSRYQHM